MQRPVNQEQSVLDVFRNAVEPRKLDLYLNNVAIREGFKAEQCPLLPTGTTSNEQRHAVFGQVWRQMTCVHLYTLRYLLRVQTIREMGSS